jgi:hypothetical protein
MINNEIEKKNKVYVESKFYSKITTTWTKLC